MDAERSLAGSLSSSIVCSVFSSEKSTGLTDARKFGCILLRFSYPNGDNFHISLCELSQPRIQRLLTLFSRLFGVPTLLPPSDKFASSMVRSRSAERESPDLCRVF